MRTNSKDVRNLVKAHILESVLNEEGQNFTDLKECCEYVYSEFQRVANYPANLHNIPNEQARFSDYLNGLPFCFEFYYSDIETFLNGLGINEEGKKFNDDKILKMYHYLIFSEVIKNK